MTLYEQLKDALLSGVGGPEKVECIGRAYGRWIEEGGYYMTDQENIAAYDEAMKAGILALLKVYDAASEDEKRALLWQAQERTGG
jgi:hypothetical protein